MFVFQKIDKLKARYWWILFLLLFQASSTSLRGNDKNSCKNILLLNSYHSTFQWTSDITRGVRDELSDVENYRVFVEHMDAKRFQDRELTENLARVYKTKY